MYTVHWRLHSIPFWDINLYFGRDMPRKQHSEQAKCTSAQACRCSAIFAFYFIHVILCLFLALKWPSCALEKFSPELRGKQNFLAWSVNFGEGRGLFFWFSKHKIVGLYVHLWPKLCHRAHFDMRCKTFSYLINWLWQNICREEWGCHNWWRHENRSPPSRTLSGLPVNRL